MAMQTVHKPEAMDHGADNIEGTNGSTIDKSHVDNEDPWEPPVFVYPAVPPAMDADSYEKMVNKLLMETITAKRATAIIYTDHTPEYVFPKFGEISCQLVTILRKDSVPCFLRLFSRKAEGMVHGCIFTPQVLDTIVACNALHCAKLVLEGKAPRLKGFRANPNYMNFMGYFPMHQAAEILSTDMIQLLLGYNASVNLRTSGKVVTEGLLPLHVAVENTCMHKYLEDNLLTDKKFNQDSVDLIYKLIHLLCLPQMKIFLDTLRVLAKYTDNVVDELWKYIEDGKIVHTTILLFAAQRQFRDLNGFVTIKDRIMDSTALLNIEIKGLTGGKRSKAYKQLMEKKTFLEKSAGMVVVIIDRIGELLDTYVQTHPKVSQQDVIGSVSSILKDHGFAPPGGIGELVCQPYDCEVSDSVLPEEHGGADMPKAAIVSPHLDVEAKDDARKELLRRQVLEHARKMYFPYWRSALRRKSTVKVYPSYASFERMPSFLQLDTAGGSQKILKKGYSTLGLGLMGRVPQLSRSRYSTLGLGLMGRVPQLSSSHQYEKLFGTAAFGLLKMLKRA